MLQLRWLFDWTNMAASLSQFFGAARRQCASRTALLPTWADIVGINILLLPTWADISRTALQGLHYAYTFYTLYLWGEHHLGGATRTLPTWADITFGWILPAWEDISLVACTASRVKQAKRHERSHGYLSVMYIEELCEDFELNNKLK